MKKWLVLFALLVVPIAQAEEPNGWADTRWGMSVADVKRLHPEAHPPISAGEQDLLMIERLHLETDGYLAPENGNSYAVRFFFDRTGGLREVTLIRNPGSEGRIQVAMNTLKTLLVQKYGQPSLTQEDGHTVMWTKTGLVVTLTHVPQFDGLSICYKTPDGNLLKSL